MFEDSTSSEEAAPNFVNDNQKNSYFHGYEEGKKIRYPGKLCTVPEYIENTTKAIESADEYIDLIFIYYEIVELGLHLNNCRNDFYCFVKTFESLFKVHTYDKIENKELRKSLQTLKEIAPKISAILTKRKK